MTFVEPPGVRTPDLWPRLKMKPRRVQVQLQPKQCNDESPHYRQRSPGAGNRTYTGTHPARVVDGEAGMSVAGRVDFWGPGIRSGFTKSKDFDSKTAGRPGVQYSPGARLLAGVRENRREGERRRAERKK